MGFIEKLLGDVEEKNTIRAVMDKVFQESVNAHHKVRNQKGKNVARILYGYDDMFKFVYYAAVLDDDVCGVFVRQADDIEYQLYGHSVSCAPDFRKEDGKIVCDFILTFTEKRKKMKGAEK